MTSTTVQNCASYMTNYARLGHAAQELLPDMLRELMLLKEPTSELIKDCNRRRIDDIRPIEWHCINNVAINGYSNFDVGLLYKLIRNLNLVQPPTSGWSFLRDPMAHELTIGDDIERIRRYRNAILHRGNAYVTDTELKEIFVVFKSVAARLETYIGKPTGYFVSKCEKLEHCSMDPQTEEQFIKIIEKMVEHETEIKEEVEKVRKDVELLKTKENDTEKLKEETLKLKEKNKLLEEEMSKMREMLKEITINLPMSITRDFFNACISEWEKDEETFVPTRAAKFVLQRISSESCITVAGCPGGGKSAIIHHAALYLRKEMDYDIIPDLKDPSELRQYCQTNKKQVFVLDDVFGKVSINDQAVDKWSLHVEMIEKIVRLGNTKLLISCRLHIFKDALVQRLKLLVSSHCNLHLNEFSLLHKERLLIAQKYMSDSEIERISDVIETYEFFPLLCKLFSKNKYPYSRDFFLNPVEEIKKNILDMKADHNKLQYCAFTLCVLFNNSFQEEWLEKDAKNENILQSICEEAGVDFKLNRTNLKQQLNNLESTYIQKSGRSYRIIHDQIYDVAAAICGQDMLQCFIHHSDATFIGERYLMEFLNAEKVENIIVIPKAHEGIFFKRIMNDLSSGNTYSLFQNWQLRFAKYRERLICFLSENKDMMAEILQTYDKLQNQNIEQRRQAELVDYISYSDEDEASDLIHSSDKKLFQHVMQLNAVNQNISLPLLESSAKGYDDLVNMLIGMGCCINICDNFGRSALFMAALNGHFSTIRLLLMHKSDASQCDRWQRSPLYVACEEGHADVVKLLIRKSDISKCDTCYFKSPLLVACEKGYTSIVRVLLDGGSEIHQSNSDGHSPLFVACAGGHTTLVKLLLEFGSDINQKDEKDRTPLLISCLNGHTEVVKLLLDHKANPSICDSDGFSPLHASCKWGHTSIVKMLLCEEDVDINACDKRYGRTPMFLACEGKHEETLKLLVHSGCSINACNKRKQSPLYIASKTGQISTVKLLLEQMTDYYVLSFNYSEWSPLIAACEAGNASIVQMLLDRNFYINVRSDSNQCPIHIACEQGSIDIVKILINHECDLNCLDALGKSPLCVACEEGHSEIVQMLLDKNALVANPFGPSLFYIACSEGNEDVVKVLFQNKAEQWDCEEETMQSPLFIACMHGYTSLVELLLKNNADVNICDSKGRSPLHIASKEGYTDIVKLLLNYGADVKMQTWGGRTALDLARSSCRSSVVHILENF